MDMIETLMKAKPLIILLAGLFTGFIVGLVGGFVGGVWVHGFAAKADEEFEQAQEDDLGY